MLYQPEWFVPVTDTSWAPHRVQAAIRAIAADVERACRGSRRLWPADPTAASQGFRSPTKCVYSGAAGTVFALDRLERRGVVESRLDLPGVASSALAAYGTHSDFLQSSESRGRHDGLLIGESGILLVAWRLAPADDVADALHERVLANIANPADDVMWGAPGTLIAAALMLEWTGDERWRRAANATAEALLARRDEDGLWMQRIDGVESQGLGPIHGAVGNVRALAMVLDDDARRSLERETAALLARTAVVEDGLVNWPWEASSSPLFLRWCAGAPGIIASASSYLDEDLLLSAGELVWKAGASRRRIGPSMCCGTAGNGYALLKVFERTGDELWLERARRFAVHALGQVGHDRNGGGPGWYSLWTGDLGVALFAADCLEGSAAYPLFDGIEL